MGIPSIFLIVALILFGLLKAITTEDDLNLVPGLDRVLFDHSGRVLLVEAAKHGRFDVVEAMVTSKKARLDIKDKAVGLTPLIAALRGGHYVIADLLIEAGADLNLGDRDGTSPLMTACKMGAFSLTETMIKKGVDTSIVDKNGFNALMYAAESGSEDIVRMLLDITSQSVGVNQKAKRDGRTALILAASQAKWGTAKILIEHGVSLDTQPVDGFAAIHLAAGQGKEAITKLLIEHGAEVNSMTAQFDQSPLYLAVKSGDIKTVTVLLGAGADPNHVSTDLGHTPLMAAAVMNNAKLVGALLEGRADPSFLVKHCDRLDSSRCSEYTAARLIASIGRTHESMSRLLGLAEQEWRLSHKRAAAASVGTEE